MAAKNKTELLEVSRKEFAKLKKLTELLSGQTAMQKDDEDASIKDVIAHRAHWIGLFLGWYADGMAGKTVYFPAKGYKWNDLKHYNAELRIQQSALGWDHASNLLRKRYEQFIDFIENHSEEQLYGGPMKGANNKWTPGRWAEAAGPSHFRSAAKYVRSRSKALVEVVS